jgi:hypothetical protein
MEIITLYFEKGKEDTHTHTQTHTHTHTGTHTLFTYVCVLHTN